VVLTRATLDLHVVGTSNRWLPGAVDEPLRDPSRDAGRVP
jgi:hypothetical protein